MNYMQALDKKHKEFCDNERVNILYDDLSKALSLDKQFLKKAIKTYRQSIIIK